MIRVYLSIPQRISVTKKKVLLGDLGQVITKDETMTRKIQQMEVLNLADEKMKVSDIVDIIRKLHEQFGELDVINLGEAEFIIQLQEKKKPNKLFEYGKVAVVSLIIFFGSAFSIMTFNEDSSVVDIFAKVYKIFGNAPNAGFPLVEAGYSIGLTLGILLFYNHMFRKKKMEDPTPMQIEMREFEKDVNETIIINSERKG